MFPIREKCIVHLVDPLEGSRTLKGEIASRLERRQRFPVTYVLLGRRVDPRVVRSLVSRWPIFKGPIGFVKQFQCIPRTELHS